MKAQNIKNRWWIHILIIASLLLVTLSTNAQADCRLLGMTAKDDYFLYNETSMVENLLDELQVQGGYLYPYYDGWCLLFYRDDNEIVLDYDIWRDADPAYNDNDYDIFQENFVNQDIEATVGMGHVRSATNVPDIPDPHPFVWQYEPYAHQFTFAHNGTVDKYYITWQINGFLDWCQENGFEPQMHGGTGEWWNNLYYVVDTEIYFFLVMWRIYLNDGDIISGIHEALNLISDLTYWPTTAKNFIFSDNTGLYAYREIEAGSPSVYELYYFDDSNCNILAAMSDPPGDNPPPGWNYINDGTLVYLPRVGNATAFEDFYSNDVFVHHLEGDESIRWNWVSFPVLEEIEPVGTNALDVLASILDPDILEGVYYESNTDPVIWYNEQILDWENDLEDENFHTIDGYKIRMNQPAVLLVSGDWELQTTEIPLYENQENWIG
ncbi:MAG: class II glutamine amidotransferase, partial [Candidatus Cloacimonadota bacterium]|nr:class II glutamine amidotransferase [Candidatus Cloacimonadota bacterium]